MPEDKPLKRPLVHKLHASPMSGEAIEAESLSIIDREAPSHGCSPEQWQVVRRMIHTTADFGLIGETRFSPDAIDSGIAALCAGRPICVDSNMIRSGLSLARLRAVCPRYGPADVACHIADDDVAQQAREAGLPRALFAMRKAKPMLDGAIVVCGNAPVALLELNRMIVEDGVRPALVIAMPVGFVHVVESKEELMSLPVPFIALVGRRGGSPLALSVVHALCSLAVQRRTSQRGDAGNAPLPNGGQTMKDEAIILLGHGSRVPGAGEAMEKVAARLKQKYGYRMVEICFMSRLGPHFQDVFEKCVSERVAKVIVIPYFLHSGLHIKLDIPKMMQENARKFPHVKLIFGKNLGYDESLVDLVEKRVAESKESCDVRNLALPPEEQYPVPPGQCEFVPMPPEQAAQWKQKEKKKPGGRDDA